MIEQNQESLSPEIVARLASLWMAGPDPENYVLPANDESIPAWLSLVFEGFNRSTWGDVEGDAIRRGHPVAKDLRHRVEALQAHWHGFDWHELKRKAKCLLVKARRDDISHRPFKEARFMAIHQQTLAALDRALEYLSGSNSHERIIPVYKMLRQERSVHVLYNRLSDILSLLEAEAV